MAVYKYTYYTRINQHPLTKFCWLFTKDWLPVSDKRLIIAVDLDVRTVVERIQTAKVSITLALVTSYGGNWNRGSCCDRMQYEVSYNYNVLSLRTLSKDRAQDEDECERSSGHFAVTKSRPRPPIVVLERWLSGLRWCIWKLSESTTIAAAVAVAAARPPKGSGGVTAVESRLSHAQYLEWEREEARARALSTNPSSTHHACRRHNSEARRGNLGRSPIMNLISVFVIRNILIYSAGRQTFMIVPQ